MDIESRQFWEQQCERLEKIKGDSVNKNTEALVLSFYAKLKSIGVKDKTIQEIADWYKVHFGIEEQKFGRIQGNLIEIKEGKFTRETLGLTETHCGKCGRHTLVCSCQGYVSKRKRK